MRTNLLRAFALTTELFFSEANRAPVGAYQRTDMEACFFHCLRKFRLMQESIRPNLPLKRGLVLRGLEIDEVIRRPRGLFPRPERLFPRPEGLFPRPEKRFPRLGARFPRLEKQKS